MNVDLSRRGFLKLAGAGAAATTLGAMGFGTAEAATAPPSFRKLRRERSTFIVSPLRTCRRMGASGRWSARPRGESRRPSLQCSTPLDARLPLQWPDVPARLETTQ